MATPLALERFRVTFRNYISDGVLTEAEWAALEAGAVQDDLDIAYALTTVVPEALWLVERTFAAALHDGHLEDSEVEAIRSLARRLRLDEEAFDWMESRIALARTIAHRTRVPLPPIYDPNAPVDPRCPECGVAFNPIPGRKKKCPSCGNFVRVKTRVTDNHARLYTEAQAVLVDAEREEYWSNEAKERSQEFFRTVNELPGLKMNSRQIAADLRARYRRPATVREIFWFASDSAIANLHAEARYPECVMLLWQQAVFAHQQGVPARTFLRRAHELQLFIFSATHQFVRIISNECCHPCQELHGTRLRISDAMHKGPIPKADCQLKDLYGIGFTRAYYEATT